MPNSIRSLFGLKKPVLTLVTLAFLQGTAQAQSLQALVEAATSHDAQWQAALAEREAVARRSDQARAPLLPQVGAAAELSRAHTRVNPTDTRFTGSNRTVAVSATQSLYNQSNRLQWSQSKLLIEQMDARLDSTAQELILRVAQAYFNLLAAQDSLTVVQAQKTAIEEQLAFAQRNFEVGNATITDTREAQAQFDLIRAQEIAALNDLQVKQLALDQVTGMQATRPNPLRTPVSLQNRTTENMQEWVSKAQIQQPLIRQGLLALDIAKLETERAEAGKLPTVDLTARLSHSQNPDGSITSPAIGTRTHQGSIGVQLNVPLFTGFAIQNRVKETLALEQQARANLDNAIRQTEQNTQTAFFSLQSGISQVAALEAAEASSLSALEANQLGYEVGVRINMDVLNAQSQLYQTRRNLAQARYNVLLGQLQLDYAAGELTLDSVRGLDALLTDANTETQTPPANTQPAAQPAD